MPKTPWKTPPTRRVVKRVHFEVLQNISSNMTRVVWPEESETGLGFEIKPSYDNVPTTSQLVTDRQSSRM